MKRENPRHADDACHPAPVLLLIRIRAAHCSCICWKACLAQGFFNTVVLEILMRIKY